MAAEDSSPSRYEKRYSAVRCAGFLSAPHCLKILRESLTVLAILLIIVLSAALAVPYFVDWNAERSLVEAQLSDLIGQQVKIRGGIDLKLLPTPYLQLADVEVADPAAGADIRASELHLEIALTALMRGEVDFVEARLVRPQIKLRLEDDKVPLHLSAHSISEQMRFERISVEDGSLAIEDPATGRTFAFEKIALNAEARALTGPFKGGGRFEMAGEPTLFHFSTGAREGDRLRFKLIVDENKVHPRAELDASLVFNPRAEAFILPSINGALNLAGHSRGAITLPWRLSGTLQADLRKATISNLDLRFGDEDHVANLDGTAEFDLGVTPHVNLNLKAQELDLDKLLSAQGAPPAMQQIVSVFGDLANSSDLVSFGMPLALEWSADSVLLGGETLTGLGGALAVSEKQAARVSFEGNGPGRSRLAFDGNVETGAAAGFKGRAEASAEDASRLTTWLAASLPQIVPAGVNLPIRSFDVTGNANVSQAGFVGSDLSMLVNGSTLSGTLAYTKALGPDAARLFADLSAPTLNLDSLPDFSALAQQAKAMDLDLHFDAHAVKVGGVGEGDIDAGRITLKFDRSGPIARLDDLAVTGLDGADLAANGQWDGHAGTIAVKLDADQLDELAGLLRRFVPGPAVEFLAARADELSPAHLNLDARGQMTDAGTFALGGLSLAGTAHQTKIAAKADPDSQNPANLVLSMRFDAQDSTALLRQIGLSTLPLTGTGAGSVEITAHGSLGHRLDTSLAASLSGTKFAFQGNVDSNLAAPHAAGMLKLSSQDLSGLMRATALALPDLATRLPADVTATLDIGGNGLSLTNLNGTFAGSKIVGNLAYGADKGITGALQIDKASLATFVALALGPPQQPKADGLWADEDLAAAQINPPLTNLSMSVANFDLWPQISGRDAHFDFAVSGTETGLQLGLHHLSMKIGDGGAEADLTLRRNGATAAAEGHLHLRDCDLFLPSARGRLGADLDLAGTGQSAAALIAGLAGAGTITFTDLDLPKSDPGALARVFNAIEQDQLGIDEAQIDRVLLAEFEKQTLSVGKADFAAGIAAGVLRLTGNDAGVKIDPGLTANLQAALDLRALTLNQQSVLTLLKLPRNWSGAPPQVTLDWNGSIANPVRSLDAASFVNALAARAIARESARIQAQEFDFHEHQFFVSRLQSERQREDEKQKAEDDARRTAELEQLRKAEAEREELESGAAEGRPVESRSAEVRGAESRGAEAQDGRSGRPCDGRSAADRPAAASSAAAPCVASSHFPDHSYRSIGGRTLLIRPKRCGSLGQLEPASP